MFYIGLVFIFVFTVYVTNNLIYTLYAIKRDNLSMKVNNAFLEHHKLNYKLVSYKHERLLEHLSNKIKEQSNDKPLE